MYGSIQDTIAYFQGHLSHKLASPTYGTASDVAVTDKADVNDDNSDGNNEEDAGVSFWLGKGRTYTHVSDRADVGTDEEVYIYHG